VPRQAAGTPHAAMLPSGQPRSLKLVLIMTGVAAVPASPAPRAHAAPWALVQRQLPSVAMGAALPPTPKGVLKASLPTSLQSYGSSAHQNTAASGAAVLQVLSPRNSYGKLFPVALAPGAEPRQGACVPSLRHPPCQRAALGWRAEMSLIGAHRAGVVENFVPPLRKARASPVNVSQHSSAKPSPWPPTIFP